MNDLVKPAEMLKLTVLHNITSIIPEVLCHQGAERDKNRPEKLDSEKQY